MNVLCPTCNGDGHVDTLYCAGGWSYGEPDYVSSDCPSCQGLGNLDEEQLVRVPLTDLIWLLERGHLDVRAFARTVFRQACVAGIDPLGTYPEEWSRVDVRARDMIERQIDAFDRQDAHASAF